MYAVTSEKIAYRTTSVSSIADHTLDAPADKNDNIRHHNDNIRPQMATSDNTERKEDRERREKHNAGYNQGSK